MKQNSKECGIIVMLAGMMLMFIVPLIGLAIDAGVVYAVKARVQAAADGAALSAARSLNRGLDLSSQQGSARDTAIRWFHANLPDHWMNITPVPDPVVTFPAAPPKTTIINVAASIPAPTYFMRILGINSVTINVIGQSTRRDLNLMLILDRSGSLQDSGSCGAVQSAATQFVNSFVSGRDRIGLVTFGTNYRVDFAPATNFATAAPPNVVTMLAQLVCTGWTNAAAAYWTAYQQLVNLNDQGTLNVLVFFTDGMPNTITFGIAPDGTDNRLPVKRLSTPSTVSFGGYDNANPSTCLDASGRQYPTAGWSPTPFTGAVSYSSGIYKKDSTAFPASPSNDWMKIGAADGNRGGCAFDANFGSSGWSYLFDVAYLPDEDMFRNKTGLGYGGGAPYAPVTRYPNTYPAAYQGRIRVDDWALGVGTPGVSDTITNAGLNALDYAAQRARDDSIARNLDVVTYTIGLGNTPGGVDNRLLRRVANDANADNYQSSKPSGMFQYAPTTAQLNQVFSKIASDVLRLSH